MRLSEAIRLGAMLKPQGMNALFAYGRTCALGAALDAIGEFRGRGMSTFQDYITLRHQWPWLSSLQAKTIQAMNDDDKLTREAIADYVAAIEPPEPATDPVQQEEEISAGVSSLERAAALLQRA